MNLVNSSKDDPGWPAIRETLLAASTNSVVVWDFDGVVADSEPLQQESYRILLTRHGVTNTENVLAGLIGKSETQIWESLRSRGIQLDVSEDDLVAARRTIYLQLAQTNLSPSWIAQDLLPILASISSRQLIVSNGDPLTIDTLLRTWDLVLYFEPFEVDLASDRLSKHQRLVQVLAEEKSVLFEDNVQYLALGRELGAFCVAVHHSMSADADDLKGDIEVAI